MDIDRVPPRGWLIVIMLFGFMVTNFADKAVLGLSAAPIMRDLELDHTQFGLVGSSFFLFFSLSAVPVGFLANRVATKWVLLAMALSWSLVQLPMVLLPVGVAGLVANRMLLGLGEGPAYPIALHATYKWFPDARRPLPTSLVALGGAVGAGLVAPQIVYVIVHYSWRAAFAMLGMVSLAWCVAWLCVGKEGPLTTETVAPPTRVRYAGLLTSRTFVSQLMVAFSAYWLVTVAVVWLPAFLAQGAGYAPSEIGWIVALPALAQIVLMPSGCALSEWLKRRGASSRFARGGLACAGLLIAGVLTLALPWVSQTILAPVCVALAFSSGNLIFSLGHVMVAEISPIGQRGSMLAICNAVATLAGPLAPAAMGAIVDNAATATAGFGTGFMLTGGGAAAVAIMALMLIDPEADRARFASVRAPDRVGSGGAVGD